MHIEESETETHLPLYSLAISHRHLWNFVIDGQLQKLSHCKLFFATNFFFFIIDLEFSAFFLRLITNLNNQLHSSLPVANFKKVIKNSNSFILHTLIINFFRFHSFINIFIDSTWYRVYPCFPLFLSFAVNTELTTSKVQLKLKWCLSVSITEKNYSYLRSHFFPTDFLYEFLIATLLLN